MYIEKNILMYLNYADLNVSCHCNEPLYLQLIDTENLFYKLSVGGKIVMPIADSPWGSYFGMITDKFGIQWTIDFDSNHNEQKKIKQRTANMNCEKSERTAKLTISTSTNICDLLNIYALKSHSS